MALYNKFLENFVLPLGDIILGGSYIKQLNILRKNLQLKEQALVKLQDEKLKNLLEHATSKSYYYKTLDIKPDSNPINWLKKFPVIGKKELSENQATLLTNSFNKLIKQSSSGSSGSQSTVFWSKKEQSIHRATQTIWWEWAGYKIGKPILQTGLSPKRTFVKSIKDKFFRTYYLFAFSFTKVEAIIALRWKMRNMDKILGGYASSLYILAQYAKQYVTVLLSGEGGDEFLGGYMRYKPLVHYNILKHIRPLTGMLRHINTGGIVNRFDKLHRYLGDNRLSSMVMLNPSDIYPADLQKLGYTINIESFEYRQKVYSEALDLNPNEPSRQAMYVDLFVHMASVLDRNDRMTMGVGIECRVPFMDYRLMEVIPALPSDILLKGKKGKYLLYNSVAQHLPKEVLSFRKLGFSVPWNKYLSEDPAFNDYLQVFEKGETTGFFPSLNTRKIIEGFRKHDTLSSALLRQLFMVHVWKESYFKRLNNS